MEKVTDKNTYSVKIKHHEFCVLNFHLFQCLVDGRPVGELFKKDLSKPLLSNTST